MTEDASANTPVDIKQGNGALWTIAGTAIAMTANNLLRNGGGLGGLFGPPPPPPGGPGAPVSREVVDLISENNRLRSEKYADNLNSAQMVVNATQAAQIACQQKQIDRLYTLTQLTIPNGNLNPGYGPAVVGPAPAPVALQAPGVSTTPDAATISAIVQAVLTAEKASSTEEG